MATERSDKLYEASLLAQQKFDYFVLGIVGALCAFIGQSFEPNVLGSNPSTVELISLLMLVASAVFGFRRIEGCNLLMQVNSKYLRLQEERGTLTKHLGASLFNESTGEVYAAQEVAAKVSALAEVIPSLQARMDALGNRVQRNYGVRNWLLLLGFLLLLASKVWAAYV